MVIMFDIETTGLDPYENQVILIGIKKGRVIRQWKLWEIKDEASLILSVLEEIEKIEYDTIIGYNNLKFDVPFMLKRLEILGKSKPKFWEVYHKKWFDLYQYLGNDYRSLSSWIRRARIERKHPELEGKDMPKYFEKKDYRNIIKHNLDDLRTSDKLFRFLKKTNPELLPFE